MLTSHSTGRTWRRNILGTLALLIGLAGCDAFSALLINPLGAITAVQLPDQPAFTVAFSVDSAVTNPSAVAKVNWVFGDGSGFVEGQPNATSITYKYLATGSYQVSAFIFNAGGFVGQINGSVTVTPAGVPGDGSTPPTDAPAVASGFSPVHQATDVDVKAKLKWVAGARAVSHDVYLGTVEADVTAATVSDAVNFKGNQTALEFDPGGLTPDTQYFWRIDEINGAGVAKGPIRSFKTAQAPAAAKSPIPADLSTTGRVDQILRWTAGLRAVSHDVYFGMTLNEVDGATKDTTDIFKGNQTAVSFDPEDENATVDGELLAATTYFWRIDEVGPGGTTKGPVWRFTTRAAPAQVGSPSPADFAVDVSVDAVLNWGSVPLVESYDVYLGLDAVDVESAERTSPEFMSNQTSRIFDPAELMPDTNYFWRIDSRGPGGTTKGVVFTFTTADAPGQVTGPFAPANNAQNASVNQTLMWNAGIGGVTQSFEIFFSTNQTDVINGANGAKKGIQDVSMTSFDLVTALAPATLHYWRIDALGPGGRTVGPILNFRTGALPGPAGNPNPANNLRAVTMNPTLQWSAGVGSTSSDVYFGTNQNAVTSATDSDAEFKGNFTVSQFNPGQLNANTDYFWRIDARSPGGALKGATWHFTTGPGQAINPQPADTAPGQPTSTTLSWAAGIGATEHDVYLGTVLQDVIGATPTTPTIYRGRQSGTNFNPGSLTANTTYFWRIDELNASHDVTTGVIWRFTTEIGKATSPTPANQATNVALNVILEWVAGSGAATHDVYFGTSLSAVTNATTASGEFRGNQASTLFDPSGIPLTLTASTTYFWRIDEVAADTVTKRTGDVWRFTTLAPPPQASGPSPVSGATGVSITPTLSWQPVSQATSYDVYFDFGGGLVLQGNQTSTNFSPGALSNGTLYSWRVDTVNTAGTTTGTVWTFTTVP